jgi:DNA-binding SARP family transcriptional activator
VPGRVEFCILGPLTVRADGTVVPVPRGKQRLLLALLLLNAGQTVPTHQLAELLWDPAPAPPSATVTAQNYVKRLRQALGAAGEQRILTQSAGYLIRVEPGELDASALELALAAGRAAAQDGDWPRAAGHAAAGLALWRGDPLCDVDLPAAFEIQRSRLMEVRLEALELRIEADLQLARHAQVVAELRQLAHAAPLREHVHALLIRALYQSGRRGEALQAYQDARAILIRELGSEPGPELRSVHQQALNDDPALAPPQAWTDRQQFETAARRPRGMAGRQDEPGAPADASASTAHGSPADDAASAGPAMPSVRHSLPPDTAAFTGRTDELDRILSAVTDAAHAGDAGLPGGVVAIRALGGMPGVGKTALAVHAAHLLADRFPDRQLFVDLHGHTPGRDPVAPADALAALLTAAGVDPRHLPAELESRSALWRDKMGGQRALLVLDNAASSAQVAPLLPGGVGCLVLVTSRRYLADLPGGVVPVRVEVLAPDQAAEMFTRLAPRAVADDPAAVAELAALTGFLPLAISLLARVYERHPAWSMADLLAETRTSLLTLTAEQGSVAAAFGVSWQHLDPDARALFGSLGLHPGTSTDAYAAAALAGLEPREAARALDRLHAEGLLTETGHRRYTMHDLISRYTAERSAETVTAQAREAAVSRLLDYYQHTAARAEALLARQARAAHLADPPVAVPDAGVGARRTV